MGCIKMLRKALIWCKNAPYKLQARVKPASVSSLFPSDASLPSPLTMHPPSIPSPWLPERQRPQSVDCRGSRPYAGLGFIEQRLCSNEGAGIKHHSSVLVSSAALFSQRSWPGHLHSSFYPMGKTSRNMEAMFPKMQLLLRWKSISHHTAGLLGGEMITPFFFFFYLNCRLEYRPAECNYPGWNLAKMLGLTALLFQNMPQYPK